MWKYVSRRIKDTIERSSNYFDVRSAAGVANNSGNIDSDNCKKSKCSVVGYLCGRNCSESNNKDEGNTHKQNAWNHQYYLIQRWIGACTLSSALVLGWYANQFLHLRNKYYIKPTNNPSPLCEIIKSNINKRDWGLGRVYNAPLKQVSHNSTVHTASSKQKSGSNVGNKTVSDSSVEGSENGDAGSSGNDLSDVLNSIENKLGLAAIENGQYEEGVNMLKSAAKRNHAPALYNLGLCYENGLGLPVNEKIAMELYRSAAIMEHPSALYNLAIYYGQGRGGLTRDINTATRLLRIAANKGQADAVEALRSIDTNNDIDGWSYDNVLVNSIYPVNYTPTNMPEYVDRIDFAYHPTY